LTESQNPWFLVFHSTPQRDLPARTSRSICDPMERSPCPPVPSLPRSTRPATKLYERRRRGILRSVEIRFSETETRRGHKSLLFLLLHFIAEAEAISVHYSLFPEVPGLESDQVSRSSQPLPLFTPSSLKTRPHDDKRRREKGATPSTNAHTETEGSRHTEQREINFLFCTKDRECNSLVPAKVAHAKSNKEQT